MLYFEDFFVGRTFALGPVSVDRESMIAFANAFDPQAVHMSAASAMQQGFSDIIASGWYTASLFMRMQCDGFLTQSSCIVSPGIDALRWLRPVYAGDALRATVTVVAARLSRSKPDRGIVESRVCVMRADGAEVMTLQTTALYSCRDAGIAPD
jgi:acyl dehydratase